MADDAAGAVRRTPRPEIVEQLACLIELTCPDFRAEPTGEVGFVRHGAGDLCQACYLRYRRHGRTVPGMVPGRRRPAPGCGPLSDADLARLRAMVGVASG